MSRFDAFLRDFERYTELFDKNEKEDSKMHQLTLDLQEIGSQVRNGIRSWTTPDLKRIVEWKGLNRVGPRITNRTRNPGTDVNKLLKFALSIREERLKIEILNLIHGVGPALASTLLTFTNPKNYGVIDYHAWNALHSLGKDLVRKKITVKKFGFKESGVFTVPELLDYLSVIRKLAKTKNTTARNVDKALFAYDKVNRTRQWRLSE